MKKLSFLLALIMVLTMAFSAAAVQENTMPIVDEPITLTYFHTLNPKVSKTKTNYDQIACYQELEKITGIKIEFVHPAQGSETEQFNLMCASQQYTDLIFFNFIDGITGGITKALDDGAAIDLAPYLEQYAPNVLKAYELIPQVKIDTMTDDGQIAFFPSIFYDLLETGQTGFFFRSDWVKKLGKELPVTIADWYDVLVAIRDNDPNGNGQKDEIPLCLFKDQIFDLSMAWNIGGLRWINRNGTAVYSPYDPAMKDYVKEIAKWYAEGLINPEYLSADQTAVDTLMQTNVGGAAFERNSKTAAIMQVYRNLGNEEAIIEGTWYPKAGDDYVSFNDNWWFKLINGSGASITSSCENIEAAVRWLDYGYSPEGTDLLNWGPEGSPIYTVGEDGKKHLSEFASKNPDGLSMDQAISMYSIGAMDGERFFDPIQYHERMMTFPIQQETNARWDAADMSATWPKASLTMEELDTASAIAPQMKIYVQETINKMIMGQVDIDAEWDKYVSTLEQMGVQTMIGCYQAALDRYNARK